jgi:hypothetical protein
MKITSRPKAQLKPTLEPSYISQPHATIQFNCILIWLLEAIGLQEYRERTLSCAALNQEEAIRAAQAVTFLAFFIRKVPDSSLGQDIDYPD